MNGNGTQRTGHRVIGPIAWATLADLAEPEGGDVWLASELDADDEADGDHACRVQAKVNYPAVASARDGDEDWGVSVSRDYDGEVEAVTQIDLDKEGRVRRAVRRK